jgi:hypothetical protein
MAVPLEHAPEVARLVTDIKAGKLPTDSSATDYAGWADSGINPQVVLLKSPREAEQWLATPETKP